LLLVFVELFAAGTDFGLGFRFVNLDKLEGSGFLLEIMFDLPKGGVKFLFLKNFGEQPGPQAYYHACYHDHVLRTSPD
jgi:hypothetical protein